MHSNLLRNFCLTVVAITAMTPAFPQENAASRQPASEYRLADDLFRKGNLGAARRIYEQIAGNYAGQDPDLMAFAEYRQAVTAAELTHNDAAARIDRFIDKNPENALAGEAGLYLGRSFFYDNKFKDAIKAFQKADLTGLSKTARDEMNFMIGYANLKLNEPASAKTYFQRVKNPKSAYFNQALYYIAHIDYIQGNYQEALIGFSGIEDDPRYAKIAPLYKLQVYHYLGDYDQVIATGPALITSEGNINKPEIARLTGNAYFNRNDFEKAAEYFEIYEEANRRSLSREDHYLAGFVNYKSGDYKTAVNHFQQAVRESDELSQNAGYYLGICYNESGQKKYAAGAFLASYKIGINKELAEEALFNYIKIGFESPFNPYNESIALLENYLRDNPGSTRADEAYDYLTRLYLTSRNYKQALASIESIGEKNEKLQAAYQKILFYRAIELTNAGDPDGALDLFQKAAAIKKDETIKTESLFWIGEIFYKKGNYPSAKKYYFDFLGAKKAKQSGLYSRAVYNLGYVYFNSQEYDDAITQFKKYLDTPDEEDGKLTADAYLRLGDAYFISKKYPEAITYYDKVILAKDAALDYALYHKALAEGAKGDFNRKIDVLKILINNYPKSSYHDDAIFETAMSYILINQESQALTFFDKLIQAYPTSAKAIQASLRKGFIYFNNNDYSQAIRSFKNVVEKYPGTQESQEALAALKNIYVETGDVDQYYAYARSLTFAEVSSSEEDSLSYAVAENFYMQGRCDQAIASFKKYLDSFAAGMYTTHAKFYQAQCFLKSNQLDPALARFKEVGQGPRSQFTEPALATASSMEFTLGNYGAALPLFEQLETDAGDPDNVAAAITGQMRCHFKLGNYPAAALAAQKIMATGTATPELTGEARYILTKGYLAQGNIQAAESELVILSKMTGTEYGAEASYHLAEIAFNSDRLQDAETLVYALSENYTAYDYWVARGFILLADVFTKSGNVFQARQTLQSIIDNYQGPELGEIAREKLKSLEIKE
ncbi:MAG TPA: tetratricopeptide repeat protein [Bacteroidales bacterium]|nr:tetratricopeptide repeat protein [Bacteroidales bacterium]HPM92818.1 tetratricopeptide repeat protein [Bacteroidales bacterium]